MVNPTAMLFVSRPAIIDYPCTSPLLLALPFRAGPSLQCRKDRDTVLQTAVAHRDLRVLGVDATKLGSLVVGQGIKTLLVDVEAGGGVVDGEDVDGLAVVGQAVAGAALGRVPASNALVAAVVGRLDVGLCLPAVLGDQAVCAVRAGDSRESAASVVIAGVVRDCGAVSNCSDVRS